MLAYFIIYIIAGVICALIAVKKGRNAVGWFFVGLLCSIIGIIIISVMSNKLEERARYEQALTERRRLREQLKIERMRNQRFHGQATQRLDMHDRALGLETYPEGEALPEPAKPILDPAGELKPPPLKSAPEWYYATEEGSRIGPLLFDEFVRHYREGMLGPANLVWTIGMRDWRELRNIDGLEEKLEG